MLPLRVPGIAPTMTRTMTRFFLALARPRPDVELSTLHPEQMQVVRLWQIYLENVNPLLRVTHSPTLQARILDAVGDLTAITPRVLVQFS